MVQELTSAPKGLIFTKPRTIHRWCTIWSHPPVSFECKVRFRGKLMNDVAAAGGHLQWSEGCSWSTARWTNSRDWQLTMSLLCTRGKCVLLVHSSVPSLMLWVYASSLAVQQKFQVDSSQRRLLAHLLPVAWARPKSDRMTLSNTILSIRSSWTASHLQWSCLTL